MIFRSFIALIFVFNLFCFFNCSIAQEIKETILLERFRNNKHNWTIGETPEYSASIKGEKYYINHYKHIGSRTFETKVDFNPLRKFFIETMGVNVSGDKENGFGIMWGKGQYCYFSFVITNDGKFYVRQAKAGGNGSYLIEPKQSPYIKIGKTNILRIQHQFHEYVFFINGKYVGYIPYQKFYGNSMGIVLYGKQEVVIGYFGVYGSTKLGIDDIEENETKLKITGYAISNIVGEEEINRENNVSPQKGENIKLAVKILNIGLYEAKNISVHISSNPKIKIDEKYKKISIPIVEVGKEVNVSFNFFVPSDYNQHDIPFKIDVVNNENVRLETLSLSISHLMSN
ncbi:MAG: hypothetical protein MJ211_09180 [Bacteroidales bacterium]|nr:hypothetical protein [Bacteroidales bacterium]